MCENSYEVTFFSKYCEIWEVDSGKIVYKAIRTHNNVYVFDDSRVSFYPSKINKT